MLAIKQHNSCSVTKQTFNKRKTSSAQNNNEDRNTPMTVGHNPPITTNQVATNSDIIFQPQHPVKAGNTRLISLTLTSWEKQLNVHLPVHKSYCNKIL